MEMGFALRDDALLKQAKRRLRAVADNVNTNGILFLWWLNRSDPENWKALYAASEGFPIGKSGLLGTVLFKYYAATGDRSILAALEKAYGSDSSILLRARHRVTNLFPAYHTYTRTGNPGIAAALDAMFKEGCDASGALPKGCKYYTQVPGRDTIVNAHGAMFLQHLSSWAVGYLWTGNTNYLNAVLGWDDWLNRVAMQPYGVPVSDEWYHPTGAFRGTETCDVAMYLEEQRDLLLVTGDAKRADRMERAFFNAAAAVLSRDCKTHVYFQSPNRFASGSPGFPDGPRGGGCDYKRKHYPLCCTAALTRILPDYLSNMWLATRDNGLAAVCYGPCRVTAHVAKGLPVSISCETDYPFGETIQMTVQSAQPATFPIHFRIPGWCTQPEIVINGAACCAETDYSFLCVKRQWKKGDIIRLRFPMMPKVEEGRDASLELAKSPTHKPVPVRIPDPNGPGKPFATVSCGPLLFALPIPDTADANTPDPAARWKYALDTGNPGVTVERGTMPAKWDWPLAAPLALSVRAVPIAWEPAPQDPRLPEAAVDGRGPAERIRLIPYGCTKFRISMFPVASEVK